MCLQLLTHPHATYGRITEAELDKNLECMKHQWKRPTSIEILSTQINDGLEFASTVGDAPTGPSIIRIAYNIVAAMVHFDVATHKWHTNAAADKTWAIFQIHFKATYSDNRLVETPGTVGYHGSAMDQPVLPHHYHSRHRVTNIAYLLLDPWCHNQPLP
jgi:hypothetical protein